MILVMTEPDRVDADDEALSGAEGRERIIRVAAEEFGEAAARRFDQVLRVFDEWDQHRHPDEGLRERKKRMTRQRISDVASALFLARGFDNVTVAEIADRVGVSEKTIYNYFPSKESLVFDQAEEQIERLTAAIRERPAGSSPVGAFVTALKTEIGDIAVMLGEAGDVLPAFTEMIHSTPALRAAWGEHRQAAVAAVAEALAGEFGVDPRDPEPLIAARAMVSLVELFHDSQTRHLTDGLAGRELQAAVEADLDRGARLVEGGLWLVHVMIEGRRTKDQVREATAAVEQARKQVTAAVREARRSWHERGVVDRDAILAAAHEARLAGRQARHAARTARDSARETAREAREAARDTAREARAGERRMR